VELTTGQIIGVVSVLAGVITALAGAVVTLHRQAIRALSEDLTRTKLQLAVSETVREELAAWVAEVAGQTKIPPARMDELRAILSPAKRRT